MSGERKTRLDVYEALADRDGDLCQWCGKTPATLDAKHAMTIDHVIPASAGGTDDLRNLQLLCGFCNPSKGKTVGPTKRVRFASASTAAGYTVFENAILLDPGLTIGARLTYAVLRHYAWQDDECYPGQQRLAENLGIGERTLRDYVRELVDEKLVRVERRGQGRTNVYVILDPRLGRHLERNPDRQNPPLKTGTNPPVKTGGSRRSHVDEDTEVPTGADRRRDPVWDTLAELYGEPAPHERSHRGKLRRDLAAALAELEAKGLDAAAFGDEIKRRHRALVQAWGPARVTGDALLKHWTFAGTLGATSAPSAYPQLDEDDV